MPGYSGKPLAPKLGLRGPCRLRFLHAPPELADWLGPLPAGAVEAEADLDFILLFTGSAGSLRAEFAPAAHRLAPAGMLWVAWPKKSSKVPTDLTEDVVRVIGLEAGLVDVKVCAVSDIWSGLKFVRRLRDR